MLSRIQINGHRTNKRRRTIRLSWLAAACLPIPLMADPICAPALEFNVPTRPPYVDAYEKHSLRKLEQLAKRGDGHAMNALGIKYGTGSGVPLDSVRSFNYYKTATESGYVPAIPNLVFMYLQGEGVA